MKLNSARYLIRFDDICPTMNWEVWDKIETILERYNINPILAVVPLNKDPDLVAMPARDDFWEQVRRWQARGWCIAMHGYDHCYITDDAGLVGINTRSEFAGLSRELQCKKIEAGIEIFRKNNVNIDMWVAPAHSFDKLTVDLLTSFGIKYISDGFYFRTVSYLGAIWVPQQLWRLRSIPFGLWTSCYHINSYSSNDIDGFDRQLCNYKDKIISFSDVITLSHTDSVTVIDHIFCVGWKFLIKSKRLLKINAR